MTNLILDGYIFIGSVFIEIDCVWLVYFLPIFLFSSKICLFLTKIVFGPKPKKLINNFLKKKIASPNNKIFLKKKITMTKQK